MGMLTKEKCLDALSALEMEIMHASSLSYWYKERVLSVSNVLFQLINEHFDNPPLKFEELKDSMCVWDNKEKMLILLHVWIEDNRKKIQYLEFGDYKYHWLAFEENRFYLREVK